MFQGWRCPFIGGRERAQAVGNGARMAGVMVVAVNGD
jgi:hypothetical protein